VRSAVEATYVEKNTFSLVKIFPNLAKGKVFNLYLPGLHNNETASVSIVDINGRTVLKTRVVNLLKSETI